MQNYKKSMFHAKMDIPSDLSSDLSLDASFIDFTLSADSNISAESMYYPSLFRYIRFFAFVIII